MPQRLPPANESVSGLGGQLLAAVLGVVLFLSFIALGFVVFLVLLVVGTAFWLMFLTRRWWLTRGRPGAAMRGPARGRGDTLEGDFKVVNEKPDKSAASARRKEDG